MTQSTHYNLNLVEGTDLVNPLVQDVPNYEAIDSAMYDNKVASIGKATELVTGTIHTLTREDSDTPVFRFTATSNFVAGETFVVDGVQVTALTPSGEALSSGSYIIGTEVLVALRDTLLTVYVSGTQVADNALALEGHPASYFGTAEDTETAQATATASGVLAQSCQTQITELNENLANKTTWKEYVKDAKQSSYDLSNVEYNELIVFTYYNLDKTELKYKFPIINGFSGRFYDGYYISNTNYSHSYVIYDATTNIITPTLNGAICYTSIFYR